MLDVLSRHRMEWRVLKLVLCLSSRSTLPREEGDPAEELPKTSSQADGRLASDDAESTECENSKPQLVQGLTNSPTEDALYGSHAYIRTLGRGVVRKAR